MATITSVGTGAWSAAGTWDSGVPADGDAVVIASGHTVTFDVDQSAFVTGIDGITVTGTLEFSRIAGTYALVLKTGKNITGTGTVNIGTSADPIPFSAKHTLKAISGNFSFVSGLTLGVYCTEPQYKYVRLTQAESAAATVLHIDTDLTGDIWQSGDVIYVVDNSIGATRDVESRTIDSITSDTITITSGLVAAKKTNIYIALMSRHVSIMGGASFCSGAVINGGYWSSVSSTRVIQAPATIYNGVFGGQYTISQCGNIDIYGGTFYGYQIIWQSTNVHIYNGLFIGDYIAYDAQGIVIEGGIFTGQYNGISFAHNGIIKGGTFWGIGYLFHAQGARYVDTNWLVTGGTFSINSYGQCVSGWQSYNVPEFKTDLSYITWEFYNEHFSPDGDDSKYLSYSKGGDSETDTVTVPAGLDYSQKIVLSSSTYFGYIKKRLSLAVGQTVSIGINLRKDSSMAILPRVYLMRGLANPTAGDDYEQMFEMTDSIDTWETDTFTLTNNNNYDEDYTLWLVGKNATGGVYVAYDIETIATDLTSVLALLNTIDGKADTIDANVDSILEDTGTDGVVLKAAGLAADAVTEIQSGLALEATLTAIKGAGWTTETLVTLKAYVDEIETRLTAARAGHLDKLNVSGTLAHSNDAATYKADVSGIPAAVWGYATRTLSSFGSLIADIWSHVTRTLSSFGFTVATNSDANVTAIKAKTDNLPANTATALAAIQADLDNPAQYKADVSALALKADLQDVEDKIDVIAADTTSEIPATLATLATTAHVQEVEDKVDAIDTDTIMSFMIDGFTFEQIVQIMASVLAGKLTRSGDTLTFRDLADTVNRVIAETDANKQRTDMTYSV